MPKPKKNPTTKIPKTFSEPKFPYTSRPGGLRKFLTLVPQKPKPMKVNFDLIKAWGLKDKNNYTIVRVLKALKLVSESGEPTEHYEAYMHQGTGPVRLAQRIRDVYAKLFQVSHQPYKEDDASLSNMFNIHSGGAESTIDFQIQTFKALCEHADFSSAAASDVAIIAVQGQATSPRASTGQATGGLTVHVDLHVHLPENKTRRDYEYMFEDIANYIYGRKTQVDGR